MTYPIKPPGSTYGELYQQYQAAISQLQNYENQVNQILGVIEELERNIATLNGLDKYPSDSDVIIPLGGLVYLKVKLTGINEVLVNHGSDVVIPTSNQEAMELLTKRKQEMSEFYQKLATDKSNLENLIQNMQAQLSEAGSQQQ